MRVVLAPDKFKGSLSAQDVIAALSTGLRTVLPHAQLLGIPVADGGEGTVAAALSAGYSLRSAEVSGPLGDPVTAGYALRDDEAVLELATASGLSLLPGSPDSVTGRTATSRGTGELISTALQAGARSIILGVGGSACTDAGAGMLQGLGARLLDAQGRELPGGGAALARLASVDLGPLRKLLSSAAAPVEFILASDVDHRLLGAAGAAAVFGPQKGLSDADVPVIEAALGHFTQLLGEALGPEGAKAASAPGAGAAGGVGYAAMAVLGAQRRPGVDVVLEFTQLRTHVNRADLVITGEGSLDAQTLAGKAPLGVAALARELGIPVIAVCGQNRLSPAQLADTGIARVYALNDLEADLSRCISLAGPLLERIGASIATEL